MHLQGLPNVDLFSVFIPSCIVFRRHSFVCRLFPIPRRVDHAPIRCRNCCCFCTRGSRRGVAAAGGGRDLAAAHALPDGVLQQLVVVIAVLAADLIGALTADAGVVVGDAENLVVHDTAQAVIVVLAEDYKEERKLIVIAPSK